MTKGGRRIPGTIAELKPREEKIIPLMDLNDESVKSKKRIIANIINKSLNNGYNFEEIANSLFAKRTFSDFVVKYQRSYNKKNNSRMNRFDILKLFYDEYINEKENGDEGDIDL